MQLTETELATHYASLEAGRNFATMYRTNPDSPETEQALEEYINLRQQLPIDPDTGRHANSREAFFTSQGLS